MNSFTRTCGVVCICILVMTRLIGLEPMEESFSKPDACVKRVDFAVIGGKCDSSNIKFIGNKLARVAGAIRGVGEGGRN